MCWSSVRRMGSFGGACYGLYRGCYERPRRLTKIKFEFFNVQSIYPDCVSSDPSQGLKNLEIALELGAERTVLLVDDNSDNLAPTGSSESEYGTISLRLSSLPPILLQFVLPETYPLSAPPSIVSLHATNSWLTPPRVNQVKKMLVEMWQPGEGVLYTWVEWIRSADCLGALDLLSEGPAGSKSVRYV